MGAFHVFKIVQMVPNRTSVSYVYPHLETNISDLTQQKFPQSEN